MKQRIILASLFAIALVWRLAFAVAVKWDHPSGDEAVAGLMAKHIAERVDFPLFYYGQAYFGAVESYLTALLFLLAGFAPNLIYVWPCIFGAIIVLVAYGFVRDIAGPDIALATAALIALAPGAYLLNTLNAGGGFGLALLMELCALWLFVRLYTSDAADRNTWLAFCALSGLLCFVWQLYIPLLPLLLVLLWLRRPALTRHSLAAGALLFVVCLFPFWAFNLANGGASFEIGIEKFAGAGLVTQLGVGRFLYEVVMNRIWNRGAYLAEWYAAISGGSVLQFALLALGLLLLARSRRPLTQAKWRLTPPMLLLVLALLEFALGHRNVRYLQAVPLLLLPCALLGIAAWTRRAVWPASLAALAVSLASVLLLFADMPAQTRPDWNQAIAILQAQHLKYGYSDYTASYVITFLSAEHIVLSPRLLAAGQRFDRYTSYTDRVAAADSVFVLVPAAADQRATFEQLVQGTPQAALRIPLPLDDARLYVGFPLGSAVRAWLTGQALP